MDSRIKLFGRNGCTQCVPVKRKVDELELTDTIEIINLDFDSTWIEQYELMSTPTLVIDNNGDYEKFVGINEIYVELYKLKEQLNG